VEPESWRRVADSTAPIAVASYGGKQRNPVALDREVWPLLPIDGDDAARVVLRVRPELIEPVACEGFPDDIDTVEDLRRWS
ncbi:MAG: nucleotidyltransferase family protein, partial [Actinomycetota bacterium]|nr:nucleotidyltransferase family protein [Actinomycetota bacterium]